MSARNLQLMCWGTYDTGKPRTRLLREGLRDNGVRLSECHATVWKDVEDKSQIKGAWKRAQLVARWGSSYPALLRGFWRAPRPDLVLVGCPGVWDVLALAPLARARKVPIVWDMFMSLYDTVVNDRQLLAPSHPLAKLLARLERRALRTADLVFLDTAEHARHVERLHALPEGKCGSVWVGAELSHFPPSRSRSPTAKKQALRVLFYGQFIPLHGIATIIRAARLLREESVEWTLIGLGQEAPVIRAMLDEDPLPKLKWIEWVEYGELQRFIEDSDVCLGIFGNSDKAQSVIPNKVFQVVASGRPLITRDSPAIRELLSHAPPCVQLVPPEDPVALADALRRSAERREPWPERCHSGMRERIGSPAVGRQLLRLLEQRLGVEMGGLRAD